MLVLEFLVEPVVPGEPGPHVLSAVAAAEELGATVEFGPFGSTCVVADDEAGAIAAAVIRSAFEHGATHVSLRAERPGAPATTSPPTRSEA